MWLIQNLLWRVYQMALMLTGMILTSVSGIFSDGWPHVFGIFIVGFFFAYFGTKLTARLIDQFQRRGLPGMKRVER